MATAITSANGGIDACNEALAILRQDETLAADQSGNLPTAGVLNQKVWRLYDSARTLVLDAYGWDCIRAAAWNRENVTTWPAYLRTAFVASLVRELAIPVTGRMGDLDAFAKLYDMKLAVAKRKDFADAIAAERAKATGRNDLALEVYSVLIGELVSDDKVPWSWSEFKNRVDGALEGARNEVLLAKDWNFAHEKVNTWCSGNACSLDIEEGLVPNMLKIRRVNGFHGRRVRSWRVLGRKLEADDLIASFEYTKDVKDLSKWSVLARRALVYCVIRDMAGSIEPAKLNMETLHQLYLTKLEAAAMHDACETVPGDDAWGTNDYAEQIRRGAGTCRARRV